MFGTLKKKLLMAVDDYFGLVDASGKIIFCSEPEMEGKKINGFEKLDFRKTGIVHSGELIYSVLKTDYYKQYYIFIKKSSKETQKVMRLLVLYTENYLKQQLEKHNEFYFYKKLLKNELSTDEIYKNASVYKIKNEIDRAVIVIKHDESEFPVSEMIANIFPDKKKNTIVDMEGNTVAYIIEIIKEDTLDLMEYAQKIVDTIEEELMISAKAGIGNITGTLHQTMVSYANACTAMSVGAIFEFETNVFNFNTLGIGKLIYNSEKKDLEEFLKETVSKKTFELLDDEIIKTMQCFFKNSLNISETARHMYIHRNTLVYRIEKVLKLTGLDLRNFDNAVSFKAAYMVKCYIDKLNQDN